jgi:hypothetical protein
MPTDHEWTDYEWVRNQWYLTGLVVEEQEAELQRLREERDGYKGYWCGFARWAQEYLDAGRWAGHSLSDAIRIELSERDDQLTDLKRRVRENEQIYDSWCSPWVVSQQFHNAGKWLVHKPGANRPFKLAPRFDTRDEAAALLAKLEE